ncbi:MAG: diguanylate cyclase [Actinobacteria bacterium BACL2 MAG-121001-bin67]|jgi:peptide/nickel transport system permease protein|uniref:Diguanylate cyclase n=3 Tax=ac1 cluster TaxID=1655545 RepID=A0A0R2P5K3_9ACTN|nr:MAG: diguanylate cyclase [Actinobacteria bacterium BACL2 MAG-121001-bin67]KRO45471.1 MAG: diguanylate cyclase [Actinobacteria bacterium BACL2 MAG-120813-bin23]KRO54250.1 MAG: diguanylate cyclase [Actinobacteria bacterium BACL2 MAG-120820-bin50]KRO74306.1 MAG: diguanylate cyclase [Actinobacteria bacterium BACL2 MAG-120920-bin34]KRP31432.1 MAG: diguanylate cyclase [Actinobacteria bacterium BACL2 MAG-120507-bin38]HCP72083.1 diguanylate cyclase [Actinomycetota bacterium]
MKREKNWVNYYLQSTSGIVGAVLVLIMITLSLISAFGLAPHDPLEQNPMDALQGPNGTYWFGTDQFGRDIFSRSIDGMRRSLSVALLSVGLATLFGVTLGVVGGYLGRWIDNIVVRTSDVIFAFPAILLALAIVNSLGNSWIDTSVAIAIVYTPIFIRVARGPVLSVKEMDYIKSARVLGYSSPRILGRHIMPNVFAPIVVQVALSLSWAILTESGLSFLGLGTQPPDASLGLMVSEAQALAAFAWWSLAFPSIFITIVVIGLNLVGDGLRDALDPARRSTS